MTNQPNVLFILSDQHNAKVLGHKAHPDVKTPERWRRVTALDGRTPPDWIRQGALQNYL